MKAAHLRQTIGVALAAPLWVLTAVFGAGSLITGAIVYGGAAQLGQSIDDSTALNQMLLSISVYAIGSGILLLEPYAIRRMSSAKIRELVGLLRWPSLKDLGYGLLAWGGYMILSVVVTVTLVQLVPGVDLDQTQDVGFTSLNSTLDIIYAFIVIVIVAPIVEELVFRGYLYGTLRPYMRWIGASLVTSVLFGFVHGQLNVGIDTFVLSTVLCYLRDRTGAIWSGILVHALKNGVAFYLLFVAPEWLKKLIMDL